MYVKFKGLYLIAKYHQSGGAFFQFTPYKRKATWFNSIYEADEAVEKAGMNNYKDVVYTEVEH